MGVDDGALEWIRLNHALAYMQCESYLYLSEAL